MKEGISRHFKPYLTVKGGYKGGKNIKASAKNPDVYKLSSNEHPFGPSPKAKEALTNYSKSLHLYPDATDERLRVALAAYYEGKLSPEQFIAGNGGSELIDLSLKAFVKEGDEIIISNPSFIPYTMFAKWLGAKVVDIPLKAPDYQLDIEGILKAINPRTRILFLTNPNNPTATYIPRAEVQQLIAALPDDILIVYDEVYWHFVDAEDYETAVSMVQSGKPVIAINSFSKTYGLASLRVGYAYTTSEIAHYIRQICRPFLIPALSMEAAIAALGDQEFVEETVKLVREERDFLRDGFESMDLSYWPSQTNFYLIDPPYDSHAFMEQLTAQGIMIRPVDNFGAPGKLRITIGTREANEALLIALRKAIANPSMV